MWISVCVCWCRVLVFSVFCGYVSSSTFTCFLLEAMCWKQLHPTGTAPSKRASHSAIYHPETRSMVVFGGPLLSFFSTEKCRFPLVLWAVLRNVAFRTLRWGAGSKGVGLGWSRDPSSDICWFLERLNFTLSSRILQRCVGVGFEGRKLVNSDEATVLFRCLKCWRNLVGFVPLVEGQVLEPVASWRNSTRGTLVGFCGLRPWEPLHDRLRGSVSKLSHPGVL